MDKDIASSFDAYHKDAMEGIAQLKDRAQKAESEVARLTEALVRVQMQGRIEGCLLCQCKDKVAARAVHP